MNYKVKVNGKNADVNSTLSRSKPYNKVTKTEFCIFTSDGSSDIEIYSEKEIKSLVVRPKSLNIKSSFDKHNIFIHLDEPKKFSVEINGSITDNILIFANEKREENIDIGDKKVVYFPKGEHMADVINLEGDNLTLYMEEGAVVHGKIRANNCNNLKICGFGAICSAKFDREDKRYQICAEFNKCKNLIVSDITVLDSSAWSMRIFGCDDVHIDNINILGRRGNSDGIDVCGSRNVLVERCFTRTSDDSFVVKAFDTGDIRNVVFRNSTLWNDNARPMEVGVEIRADKASDIRFENIDVIHSSNGYPIMGIHHGDRAKISNVEFSDIRIEDAPGAQVFDIRITDSVWNKDKIKGGIDGVTIKNIYITEKADVPMSKSRIEGYSDEVKVSNVTIENINYLGKTADTKELCGLIVSDYAENINVIQSDEECKLLHADADIKISKPFTADEDGMYSGEVSLILSNNNSESISGNARFAVSPANSVVCDNRIAYCLRPGETTEKTTELRLQPGKYVFELWDNEYGLNQSWYYTELGLVLGSDIGKAAKYRIYNYYGNVLSGIKLAVKDEKLIISSEALADNVFTVYSCMPVPPLPGEVKFTVEETDFGEGMAIMDGRCGLEAAPQLRNPMEIWMVFKNEPKVKEIFVNKRGGEGKIIEEIPLKDMGVEPDSKEFLLEIAADIPEVRGFRYPFTMFHSVCPQKNTHMYAKVIIK